MKNVPTKRQVGVNDKLKRVYDQIPQSTCPPNCGKCCGILYPSLAELANVKEWCELHHREFKDFNMLVGDNCPYLSEEKECVKEGDKGESV